MSGYVTFAWAVEGIIDRAGYLNAALPGLKTNITEQVDLIPGQMNLTTWQNAVTAFYNVKGISEKDAVVLVNKTDTGEWYQMAAFLGVPASDIKLYINLDASMVLNSPVETTTAATTTTTGGSGGGNRKLLQGSVMVPSNITTSGIASLIVQVFTTTNLEEVMSRMNEAESIQTIWANEITKSNGGVSSRLSVAKTTAPTLNPIPTTFSITSLLQTDIDDGKAAALTELVTRSEIKEVLVGQGQPDNINVVMVSQPQLTLTPSNVPPGPAPPSPPSPPVPPAGNGGGTPSWVWIIVGVAGGLAVVAAVFVGYVTHRKRQRRREEGERLVLGGGGGGEGRRQESIAKNAAAVENGNGNVDDRYNSLPLSASAAGAATVGGAGLVGSARSFGRALSSAVSRMTMSPRDKMAAQEAAEDDFPLGSVEQPSGGAPLVDLPLVQIFKSDRQKAEPEINQDLGDNTSLIARILLDRTGHLKAGAAFLGGRIRMVEGTVDGTTYVCRNGMEVSTGRQVTVKFYSKSEDYQREKDFLDIPELNGDYVPTIVASDGGDEDMPPYVVTVRGDFSLADVLIKTSRPPEQQRRIIIHDISTALSHLHSLGAVHMDVNPYNISFFGAEGRWKLINFENWAEAGARSSIHYCLRYAAPEVVSADILGDAALEASPQIDCWSLGVVAYEVLIGTKFFPDADMSDQEVMKAILGFHLLPSEGADTVLAEVEDMDSNACRMLRHLIRRQPDKRWNSARVADCVFFQAADFEAFRVTN
jgi:serine/threonine protein kinase